MCFFSATLHSPAITQLAQNICMNATWVDLKGPNSIPEHVHHVIYRMDLVRDRANVGELSTGEVPKTDGIYDIFTSKLSPADEKSLQIKRLKPHLLVKIIEKFKVLRAPCLYLNSTLSGKLSTLLHCRCRSAWFSVARILIART